MKNPFIYGTPVANEFFFETPEMAEKLRKYLFSGINVLLMGPRRRGKTSFLKNFFLAEKEKGTMILDIDALSVTSHRDFFLQLVQSLKKNKSLLQELLDIFRSIPKLRPTLEYKFDPTGDQSFSLSLHELENKDIKFLLLQTFDNIFKSKRSPNEKFIVSIDEFQKVGELEDRGWLEATLRTFMQNNPEIHFIFTGSRRALLEKMFNDPKRPFYHSCQIINFEEFGPKFSLWVLDRLKKAGISCEQMTVDYLRQKVDDSPYYVQMVGFHLVAQGLEKVSPSNIDETIDLISMQSSYSYEALLNALTPSQIRFLRMLADHGKPKWNKQDLKRYEFKSGSNIQSAARSLVEKQILEKNPITKTFIFDDPLFKVWLTKKFLGGII